MSWLRRRASLLLTGYLVFLALVLFSPSPRLGTGGVDLVTGALQWLGLPTWLASAAVVERAENVLVVAPVSLLGSLVWRRLRWRDWTAWGFLAALAVESVQALLLSERTATASDVVANTLGMTLGALLAAGLVRRAEPARTVTRSEADR